MKYSDSEDLKLVYELLSGVSHAYKNIFLLQLLQPDWKESCHNTPLSSPPVVQWDEALRNNRSLSVPPWPGTTTILAGKYMVVTTASTEVH